MELTDIKGVGKSTAKKLEKHGYSTVEDLQKVTVNDLTDIGVPVHTAREIVESVQQTNPKKDTSIQYHIKDANKFRLHAFKQSNIYDPDNLEKSYDVWWKQVLEKHREVNHG